IGILARQGKLSLEGPAPVRAWADPDDPHHAITVDELLRQTSGQPFGSSNSGFDRSSQMQFLASDTASVASNAKFAWSPGAHWSYTDGNYAILSGIIRDAVGGDAAHVVDFSSRELFAPLGMKSVVQEFDEAGSPFGACYINASPRDWARFALL